MTNAIARRVIGMEYLYDGMTLADDIFDSAGDILLLAKGIVINDQEIRNLKRYNAGSENVSVSESTFHTLMGHWLETSEKEDLVQMEKEIHYTGVTETASEMLEDSGKFEEISKERADSISEEIYERIISSAPALLFQCINAPREIDEYLKKHCVNVALLNGMMGRWLNLSEEDIGLLIQIGLLHDIGKTKLPQELLDEPRKLAICEYEVVKTHTNYSLEMLNNDSRFPDIVKNAVLLHHEKTNGSGYPLGISGERIPLFAKITSISDVYDAMVAKRAYKKANTPLFILARMAQHTFPGLDLTLVSTFIEHLPNELIGSSVLLSDGSVARIKEIPRDDLEHPFVELRGEIIKTSNKLYCVRMVYQKEA